MARGALFLLFALLYSQRVASHSCETYLRELLHRPNFHLFNIVEYLYLLLLQVKTNDGTSDVSVTSSFVQMSNGCIQGSYVDMPVRRNATKVFVELNRDGSYVGLSELEIFIEGKEIWERLVCHALIEGATDRKR